MRSRGRVDANHSQIVNRLREYGASVEPRMAELGKGAPDLLVGFRGQNVLMEIKDGTAKPSRRRLTKDEQRWHQTWAGQIVVVESEEEALKAIGL